MRRRCSSYPYPSKSPGAVEKERAPIASMKYCDSCHSTFPGDFTSCPKCQTGLRNANELMPGMILREKYEILARIGSGGMAAVYRAKHLAFGEERAIKVVSAKLADDENFLKRFKQEAIVTRKLQHPNAVRVDDLDATEDGRPFIVMECVEGRDLRKVLEKTGPMPIRRALKIVEQIALALAAAHELGITHRDIKPDNVLILKAEDGGDLVKVLDFGIAKVKEGTLEGGQGYTATQTGVVIGTPQYMSPEQALGRRGDEIDGRSDIYSLGVVLYELLTGELPFVSETPMEFLFHHMQTEPTPPHRTRPNLRIPSQVSDVLMKTLEKDPEDRFASADDLAKAVALLAEMPETAVVRAAAPAAGAAPALEKADTGAGASRRPAETADSKIATRPRPRTQPGRPLGTRPPRVGARAPGVRTGAPSARRPPEAGSGARLPQSVVVVGGILLVALVLWAFLLGRGAGPDDQKIRADVEAALAASAPLDGHEFGVRVSAGVVTVSGEMEAREDAVEAVALASAVPGVVSVSDALRVVASEPVPRGDADAEIQVMIRSRLAAVAELRYESIDAAVEKRIVTLSGRVASASAAALAVRIAQSVAGVGGVRNFIEAPDAGGVATLQAAPEPLGAATDPVYQPATPDSEAREGRPAGDRRPPPPPPPPPRGGPRGRPPPPPQAREVRDLMRQLGGAEGIGDPRAKQLVAEGQAKMQNGEFDAAIASFEEAMRVAPGDPQALLAQRLAATARAMKEAERR